MKVGLIVLGEFDPDFLGDGQGHFPLQGQYAAAFPVVLVRPKRLIGPPVHEADTDPNLIPVRQHRTFDHCIHAQFASNLGDRPADTFVLHRRGSRDDMQRLDLGQVGDQRVGHAVGKIALILTGAQVCEGQHCHGRHRRLDTASEPVVRGRCQQEPTRQPLQTARRVDAV